ncbi:DUF5695 domain-containing protein [Pedobacter sp. L105]|uniref:DUF5695 domain-containing protein n=1 Tax=Pedobacter sp. L105 TaxID=1641871 RepID=UPI001C20615F|nr:DUF5695 domain-containing protein [Pedobacter sp. L105]
MVFKNKRSFQKTSLVVLAFIALLGDAAAYGQTVSIWKKIEDKPATLNIAEGVITINTSAFQLKLLKSSQTVAALDPNTDKSFDFTPGEVLEKRSRDGLYHLGDLNLRFRTNLSGEWRKISTAAKRGDVTALKTGGNILAAADLSGTLPNDIPFEIKRYWELINGELVLHFNVKNKSTQPVEIGGFGMPVIFNNVMIDKTLEQTHAQNVFYDPYIGKDAGYLQVTRLTGKGQVLLVVPYGKTPFEAYNPLLDDPTPRGITFEGFYEWMALSKANAEQDWKAAEPWNTPTALILKSGESKDYGLKFILADSIRGIEKRLVEEKRPVAVGIPGYVIPEDIDAKLFLNYPSKVSVIETFPANAITFTALATTPKGWKSYQLKGNTWGRVRVTVNYEDGTSQTIQYKVIKPETKVIDDFGRFLTHEQWFQDKNDFFGRNNSVISYDIEKKQQVKEDSRAWIAGLSDEGGAGGWLGAMMKELVRPDKEEIEKLQLFANHTLWGGLQHSEGAEKYGVKKSMFYYQPDSVPAGTYSKDINYKTWAAWNHVAANDIGRSYNYPHVAAAHWVLYRLARNHTGLVTEKKWDWHLDNAYQTTMAMVNLAPYYVQFGQMEGSVFYYILMDLKAEGWNDKAAILEAAMKKRAEHWHTLDFPFGSEMPWDSTGQEEVYVWSDYFGYKDKADVTLNAILGYMPTIPHWGYNGSARRYWDFLYGGKLSRVERQLHHYGSSLNAIPVLDAYRRYPKDLYLLRVGYGGLMGSISNITQEGFGSAAFHSFPSTLKIDGLSGDYGSGFYGYAVNTATYITHDDEFGWLAFGGNLKTAGDWVTTKITTAERSKVFVAPAGIWLTLDAGTFNTVSFNLKTAEIKLSLDAADGHTPVAYLRMSQTTPEAGAKYMIKGKLREQRGAYVVPLKNKEVVVEMIKL